MDYGPAPETISQLDCENYFSKWFPIWVDKVIYAGF